MLHYMSIFSFAEQVYICFSIAIIDLKASYLDYIVNVEVPQSITSSFGSASARGKSIAQARVSF